jgi:ParB family transcriptional regulator, chromosome partitioning protein
MMQAAPKRRLGRGLAALIGDDDLDEALAAPVPVQITAEQPAPVVLATSQTGLRIVPIDMITANPNNPRKTFREEELSQLADSIKAKGLLQPLVVRPKSQGTTHYELVAGERRWRAAQRAQLHAIPVLVRELDDRESLEIAIIENIQRADLNPLEEALGYKQLMEQYSYTQQQLADGLGKSRSHITNTMRLLNLPHEIRTRIEDGSLTAGHARTLVAAEKPQELADEIIKLGLSVRGAEELVRKSHSSKALPIKDIDTLALEKDLSNTLGLRIDIQHKGDRGGRLVIDYKTLDQLDDVIRRLQKSS